MSLRKVWLKNFHLETVHYFEVITKLSEWDVSTLLLFIVFTTDTVPQQRKRKVKWFHCGQQSGMIFLIRCWLNMGLSITNKDEFSINVYALRNMRQFDMCAQIGFQSCLATHFRVQPGRAALLYCRIFVYSFPVFLLRFLSLYQFYHIWQIWRATCTKSFA